MKKTVLTLTKEFEQERHRVPTISYQVSSHAEKPFRLRIKEEIPERIPTTELRFDTDDADDWRMTDGMAVFERRVGAGADVSTLFGVLTDDTGKVAALDARPTVEVAPTDSREAESNWVTVSDEQFEFTSDFPESTSAKVVASDGGKVSLPSDHADVDSEQETAADEDSTANSLESAIPSTTDLERDDGDVGDSRDESAHADRRGGLATTADATIVDEFVGALQNESLSEAHRETLRAELGLDAAGSMNARIEHCQTRLSDLSAYVDAFEELLEEDGSARQLIDDFRSDLDAVAAQVAALESEVASTAETQEQLRERVDEMEAQLSGLGDVEEDVESLEARLDSSTGTLQANLDAVRATVDDLEAWQGKVSGAFAGADSEDEA